VENILKKLFDAKDEENKNFIKRNENDPNKIDYNA
jgi:hypothetical protein